MKFIPVLLLLIAACWPDQAEAQCAMCRATNESAIQEGEGLGINQGIIYLMGIPYLLLGILGWVFFRKRIGNFFRDMQEIHE